jgi:hypothetical protein
MVREQVGRLLSETLRVLWNQVAAFVPNLLAMLLILMCGAVVAGIVRIGVRALLSAAGFDQLASRTGLQTVLERAGVTPRASMIVARVLAWTVFVAFVIIAIGALNLQLAAGVLSRALQYLPQVFVALALLVLGALLAAFTRRTVLIAAVNAGMQAARLLATAAQAAVIAIASAMALEHLGVGRQIIMVAFAIIFGGVVLAVSLALGLGGRELARDALQRLFQRLPSDAEPEDPRRHI